MTIEQDIDFNLIEKDSKRERGCYAYHVLERFDQVAEELSNYPAIYSDPGKDEIMRFMISGYIPPTIRLVVKHYGDNNITRNEALCMVRSLRKRANEYFLVRGCDPKIGEEEEKQSEQREIRAFKKKLGKAIDDCKAALKELGMTNEEIEKINEKK